MTGSRQGWTVVMLAPSVGLMTVFVLVPMALTIYLSFHRWSSQTPFSSAHWIGFDNYQEIFGARSAVTSGKQ